MTTLEETDWFGNEYLENGVKLRVPVDFAKSYNGFLKAAKNTSDPSKIIQNLYFYSRNNPHTAAVMDRFFNDIGVSPEDIGTGNIDNVNDPGLYMSFIKGFENYVADYLFIHTSANDGRVVSYSAANRDDANTQFDNWSNAYFTLYNTALKIKQMLIPYLEV
ncbi:MAG: hypothetical protein CM15mV51_1130 [uncultured marine virus]|nr:MAG: hypothetical protein CM15mV51_1130 [uncultured marine virus]